MRIGKMVLAASSVLFGQSVLFAEEGFQLKLPAHVDRPAFPVDNPLTVQRASLGEALFIDKALSRDYSVSCSTCHNAFTFFSDQTPLSRGVDNQEGTRNTPPIFNMAWKSKFFWDGRSPSLRAQALAPIQDPTEMDLELDEMVKRLSASPVYRKMFEEAFGSKEITTLKVGLALENFMFTLTSFGSKYDRVEQGKEEFSELEKQGKELFFTSVNGEKRGAGCFECHSGSNFADGDFHNNGIGERNADLGRFVVTRDPKDKLKFATPSLRNLGVTAPYMHDGRLESLEEVIEHYSSPMEVTETLAPEIKHYAETGLQLSAHEKRALLAFLATLDDHAEHPLPGAQRFSQE